MYDFCYSDSFRKKDRNIQPDHTKKSPMTVTNKNKDCLEKTMNITNLKSNENNKITIKKAIHRYRR